MVGNTDTDRDRLTRAWLDCWDVVHDASAASGVTIAMPWRSAAVGRTPCMNPPAVALRGHQRVTWIGFHPDRGLLHGEGRWDPSNTPRPVPPLSWKREPFGDLSPHFHEGSPGGMQYEALPMPRSVVRSGDVDPEEVHSAIDAGNGVPLARFVEGMGIPARVFNLVQCSYVADDVALPIPSSRLKRDAAALEAILWCAGNGGHPDVLPSVARARRVQAVTAMPCFVAAIARSEICYDVVDRGMELVPAVAGKRGCSPATVRILAAHAAASDGSSLASMARVVASDPALSLLDAMPRDTLRSMLEEIAAGGWQCLVDLAAEFHYTFPPSTMQHIGAGLRSDRRIGWGWLVSPRDDNRWEHLQDVAFELSRDLLWPAEAMADPDAEMRSGRDDRSCRTLSTAALASIGAARLGRVLDAHMAGALRRAAEVGAGDGEDDFRWPVPAEPVTAGTGQTVRFLSSARELAEEGLKMDHCVGDYADACREGRCAIMSIGRWADGEWKPSSTVELERSGSGEIEVSQHHGRGNRPPSRADVLVLREWIAGLETGETLFDGDVLQSSEAMEHVSGVMGEAWSTPEAHGARWDRWRRILGVRQCTASAFLRHAVDVTGVGMDLEGFVDTQALATLIDTVSLHDARMAKARGKADSSSPASMPDAPVSLGR